MNISVKRVYDTPSRSDGTRILADRLWPRGKTKAEVGADIWAKDLAPSNALRQWYHQAPEKRFADFNKKYRGELKEKRTLGRTFIKGLTRVTLVTAAKDIEHSHIPELTRFLKRL